MNYLDAIDPNFGQYTIHEGIIVTPFWKKEFCDYIIEKTRQNKDKFEIAADLGEPVHYLNVTAFDRELSDQIGKHFITDVRKMLVNEWHLPPYHIPRIYTPYILWYEKKKFERYMKHTDHCLVSTNIKLNDDYTGCNITFPKQNFSTKDVPIGHAVLWPGFLTHPHYADDLIEGEKFSVCIFAPGPKISESETIWGSYDIVPGHLV